MDRRKFLKVISGSAFSAMIAPGWLLRFLKRNQLSVPMDVSVIAGFDVVLNSIGQISAVGIGPLGAKMARAIIPDLPGITCHELSFDPKGEQTNAFAELFYSVRQSNLLFILAGFDDYYCEVNAQAVGKAARHAGVLTIAVTPCSREWHPQSQQQLRLGGMTQCFLFLPGLYPTNIYSWGTRPLDMQ